ncbi:MAG: hypothetical protein Q9174_000292 [Haloplaca sp. 1 TL-2023]
MASDLDTLLDMGFDKPKAELAVKKTGGLQGALEWLEKNQDKSYEEITAESAKADDDPDAEPAPLQPGEQARSLLCNECGKKFRSQAQAEFHASKTQHVDFAESTEEIAPLTEEQKKARLEDLRQQLAEKRAGASEQDKIDKKRNEEIRRKSTKETQDIKEDLKKKEQLKEAAAKRKEKQDEIEAKARIKAKIAADKEERRLRNEKEKAEREGRAPPVAAQAAAQPATASTVEYKPASAYTEARLRLQTSQGNLLKTFPVTTTLFEVASAVNQDTGGEVKGFEQGFPKRVYGDVDFGASLKELGLVPSASLKVVIGDQHKAVTATDNPFEDTKSNVNEYTAREIATLSSRLEKRLGPEYISTRPGASGAKVPYLAGDKAIQLANEVFGFNGWSSGIQQIQIDFVEESPTSGKVSLGLSVIVRVTLRDGTYHEDLGYGSTDNYKSKAAAFEKAKKQGVTDALKRALRNFGNILGNCLNDKDYMSKVTKMKVAPSKWDPDNLHRHTDYAPLKKEAGVEQSHDTARTNRETAIDHGITGFKPGLTRGVSEQEDEFATDDFDEVDFSVSHELNPADSACEQSANLVPSRVDPGMLFRPLVQGLCSDRWLTAWLTTVRNGMTSHDIPGTTHFSGSNDPSTTALRAPLPQQQPPHQATKPQPHQTPVQARPQLTAPNARPPISNPPLNTNWGLQPTVPPNPNADVPVGFYNARAATAIQNSPGVPPKAPSFNPHSESPSIRKTAGIDHTKTKPVGRDLVGAPAPPPPPAGLGSMAPASRSNNFVNPQADKARRVGMPMAAGGSPLSNRTSYKPPQLKRPAEGGVSAQQPRPALNDVTAATVNVPSNDIGSGGDQKRQKVGEPANGQN